MGKGRTFQGAVAMSSGQQSARGYSRADSLGGESTKSSKSSKSTTSPKETFGKDALVYFAKRAGILSVSIGVGVLYTTQRFNWPVEYAFYWAMVTALTVGYGDFPVCQADLDLAAAAEAAGNASTCAGAESLCDYRNIYDNDGDMIFVCLYCTWVVLVALSLLTEFLESLESKQRMRETRAQFKLLEAYFNGESLDVAKEKAIWEDGDSDGEFADADADWTDAEGAPTPRTWSWWYCCFTGYVRRHFSKEGREIMKATFWHVILVFIGIIAFSLYYDESAVRSAYYIVITSLAVGFGDTTPSDPVGYGVGFFYITMLVVSNIQLLMQYVQLYRGQAKVSEVLSMTFDPEVFKEFNKNGDGEITEAEYLAGTLVLLGKVDRQTIDLINKQFACLDLDGGGTITIDELDPEAQKQARIARRINSIVGTSKAVNTFTGLLMRSSPTASDTSSSGGGKAATVSLSAPFANKTFNQNLADGFRAAHASATTTAPSPPTTTTTAAATPSTDADVGGEIDLDSETLVITTTSTSETEFAGFEILQSSGSGGSGGGSSGGSSSHDSNLPEMTVDENGQAGLAF